MNVKYFTILDDFDEGNLEPDDFFLHVPDEPGDVISDVGSDFSEEESAGNLTKLRRRWMQTQCEYIPHAYTDASDDEDEDANTYEEAQPPSKKEIEVEKRIYRILLGGKKQHQNLT